MDIYRSPFLAKHLHDRHFMSGIMNQHIWHVGFNSVLQVTSTCGGEGGGVRMR